MYCRLVCLFIVGAAVTRSIFAWVLIAIQLVFAGVAHAECNFFTGWVDNKDGTVRDPRNGLIWKRCAEGFEFANGTCTGKEVEINWRGAKSIAQQSRFLNQSDWRLPSKEEFAAVMGSWEDCGTDHKADRLDGVYAHSKAIVHVKNNPLFWTSSLDAGDPYAAWVVNSYWGNVFSEGQSREDILVRLVRASPLLGGEAASEFVNEKEDARQRVAAEERHRIAEEARLQIVEKEEARQRQLAQDRASKKLAAFRKSLREGDDTNCGPVIELKGRLVKVAFAVANYGNEHWIKREQVLSPDYGCRFVNGQYQSEQ